MYRRSVLRRGEFETRKWYERFPKVHHYGDGPSPGTEGRVRKARTRWQVSFRIVTKDSNRLQNRYQRYEYLKHEMVTEKNTEELKIMEEDLQMYDNRSIWWKCPDCKSLYKQKLGVRQKYGTHCPRCTHRYPSAVNGAFSDDGRTLAKDYPELCDEIDGEKEDANFIKSLSPLSLFKANWLCRKCGDGFQATVRHRTGAIRPEDGFGLDAAQVEFCPSCMWSVKMHRIGEAALASGSWTGYEEGVIKSAYNPYSAASMKQGMPVRQQFRTEVPPPPPKKVEGEDS